LVMISVYEGFRGKGRAGKRNGKLKH
jgi:hypothetical protein